jgi:hypothetical protein
MPETNSCSANQILKFYRRTHSSTMQIVTEPDEFNPHSHTILLYSQGSAVLSADEVAGT